MRVETRVNNNLQGAMFVSKALNRTQRGKILQAWIEPIAANTLELGMIGQVISLISISHVSLLTYESKKEETWVSLMFIKFS